MFSQFSTKTHGDPRWNFNPKGLKSCFTVVVPGFPLNLGTKLTETPRQILTTFPMNIRIATPLVGSASYMYMRDYTHVYIHIYIDVMYVYINIICKYVRVHVHIYIDIIFIHINIIEEYINVYT